MSEYLSRQFAHDVGERCECTVCRQIKEPGHLMDQLQAMLYVANQAMDKAQELPLGNVPEHIEKIRDDIWNVMVFLDPTKKG